MLCIFTVLFVVLVVCLWRDFSKKVERDVNHNEFLTSESFNVYTVWTIVSCVCVGGGGGCNQNTTSGMRLSPVVSSLLSSSL